MKQTFQFLYFWLAKYCSTIAADLSGTIRLGCFHALTPFYLARLVKDYRSIYPGVLIDATEQRQDELLAGLMTESRDYFRTTLANHGIDPPIAFRSSSLESVRSAVGNGLGFSLMVMRVDRKDTYDGHHVAPVQISEDIDPIRVVLAWKRGRDPSLLIQNFKDYCSTKFSQT